MEMHNLCIMAALCVGDLGKPFFHDATFAWKHFGDRLAFEILPLGW